MPAIAVVVLYRKDFWNPRWAFSGYTTAFPFHQICAICNKFCQTLYESIYLLLPQAHLYHSIPHVIGLPAAQCSESQEDNGLVGHIWFSGLLTLQI